jgi:S1-C subfamily serine protease
VFDAPEKIGSSWTKKKKRMNPFSEEMNELFEKMASGEGSNEERILFFQELEASPSLNKLFEQHLEFRKSVGIALRRNALRGQIMDYPQQIKSNKIKVSNPISISRWAIAASISALIAVGSWFAYEWEQKQKSNGEQLLARSTTKSNRSYHSNPSSEAEVEMVSGTAFAVNSEGYFLSTSHIIGNKTEVQLENPEDGKVYDARVVARDSRYDLVLVKIDDEAFDGLDRIPYPIKSSQINLAQEVFTLGFPKEDVVFGEGSVSSLNGFNGDSLKYQVSVPVNPGQSGSPLFDECGNVIGIISAKNGSADGVSYAIKASYILDFFKNSIEDPIELPKGNQVSKLPKTRKIQKISPFIFMVRA